MKVEFQMSLVLQYHN